MRPAFCYASPSPPQEKRPPEASGGLGVFGNLFVADAVDISGEVEHLVGEAPLVVVPGDELDEVGVQADAGLRVDY